MIADMGSRGEFTQNTKMRNDEMMIGTMVARMDLYKRKNITDILFRKALRMRLMTMVTLGSEARMAKVLSLLLIPFILLAFTLTN